MGVERTVDGAEVTGEASLFRAAGLFACTGSFPDATDVPLEDLLVLRLLFAVPAVALAGLLDATLATDLDAADCAMALLFLLLLLLLCRIGLRFAVQGRFRAAFGTAGSITYSSRLVYYIFVPRSS